MPSLLLSSCCILEYLANECEVDIGLFDTWFKYGVGYTGLHHPHSASEFICHMPSSELAMSINHRHDNAGQTFSIAFNISYLKWRILVPP